MHDLALQIAPMSTRCELLVESPLNDGRSVMAGLLASLQTSADEPVLLISRMHAAVASDGKFFVVFDVNTLSSGTGWFQAIGMLRRAPVHIFMTSCRGKAVLESAHHLPAGSTVVVLANTDQTVLSADVDALYTRVGRLKCLNAVGLLLLHCACTMTKGTSPSVYTPDGAILDLALQLAVYQGHAVSASDRVLIHEQLDGLMGKDQVKSAIAMLESPEPIPDASRGKALAVAAVLSGLTVDPGAVAPRNPQAMVHNVLLETAEVVDPPGLNLGHEGVKAMLTRRGQVVVLPDRSGLCYGKTTKHVLLTFEGQFVRVAVDRNGPDGALRVKAVQGPADTIAHFQRIGVLQGAPDAAIPTSFHQFLAFV